MTTPRFNRGAGGLYHPPGNDIDQFGNLLIHLNDPIDAFDRVKVSNPDNLFDSKLIFDNQPLLWDDQEETGSGTSSTYDNDNARVRIAVGATTAGERTRQTFMRFNYQPGKAQQITMTGVLNVTGGGTGIFQRIGYFDDDNGLFFENNEGTIQIVRRTSTSGSAVDNAITRTNWDDPLDGTGRSGLSVDFTKAQIFHIEFQWLGIGIVNWGLFVNGEIILVHQEPLVDDLTAVYMSKPSLPLRYQIENDGTGAAASLDQICAAVISEGGMEETGVLRYKSTEGTHVDANAADTLYAVVGIRLKSAQLASRVTLESMSMISETNDDFEWVIQLNPTVAGTFTYSDETNSSVQTATGATANTVTGGTDLEGGWGKTGQSLTNVLNNSLLLGAAIDGTVDEIVLCTRPLSNNADIQGSLTWREST